VLHRLHRTPPAEKHVLALIDDQQHRSVAFLAMDADVRLARPRRDRPVHMADVVAGQVAADLLKVQPAQP
jgi:hypothetical protein